MTADRSVQPWLDDGDLRLYHGDTAVFEGHDEPRKPWTATCDCGYISWHTTENAAKRALVKHLRLMRPSHRHEEDIPYADYPGEHGRETPWGKRIDP